MHKGVAGRRDHSVDVILPWRSKEENEMFRRLVSAWLRSPLRIGMDFQDRPYVLGETIDLTIELKARRSVQVREARVELMCEHRYAESYTRMIPVRHPGAPLMRGAPPPMTMVPKREVIERVESHVHGSVVLLKDGRLDSGQTVRHDVKLEIRPEPLPQTGSGVLIWTLVTTVDISGGRDVAESRRVTVDLD